MKKTVFGLLTFVLFFLFSVPLFAVGERERTRSQIRDLIDEGDYSGAMDIIIQRYEANNEEFDLWFIRESSEIIKIEQKYTELVNQFTDILNKGQENITDDDLTNLYEIILQMTELKPIPPEEARNFITQARRIAGGIANGKKMSQLMNEALALLDQKQYSEAAAKYVSGFTLNRDVFDESEFPDSIVQEVDALLGGLRFQQGILEGLISKTLPKYNSFRDNFDKYSVNQIKDPLLDLLSGIDEINAARMQVHAGGAGLREIERNVIDEYGTDKDIYFFRFLDFMINGRNPDTKRADGVPVSANEGLATVYSDQWLDIAEPVLDMLKTRASGILDSAERAFDTDNFRQSDIAYGEVSEMAGCIMSALASWQKYLFIDSGGDLVEIGNSLIADRPVSGIVLSNYLYAQMLQEYAGLQISLAKQYDLLDERRTQANLAAGKDDVQKLRELLIEELSLIGKYEKFWDSSGQALNNLASAGYDTSEALEIQRSAAESLADYINANHANEAEFASIILDFDTEQLNIAYNSILETVRLADSRINIVTTVKEPDLEGGTISISYSDSSKAVYKNAAVQADSLAVQITELSDTNDSLPAYITKDQKFISERQKLSALEQNLQNTREYVDSAIFGIDLKRMELLSGEFYRKVFLKFDAQKNLYNDALNNINTESYQESRTLDNSGERKLEADYPQKSRNIIDSVEEKLDGIINYIDLVQQSLNEKVSDYPDSTVVSGNVQGIENVRAEAEKYLAGVKDVRDRIETAFQLNAAYARYNPVFEEYNNAANELVTARSISSRISTYLDDSLEGTEPVRVQYAGDSDDLASAASEKMEELYKETGSMLEIFNSNEKYVLDDNDYKQVLTKTRLLQDRISASIKEAEDFLFAQRSALADKSAVARADYIEQKMNEFRTRIEVDARTTGIVSTRQISYEGIPEVSVEYNFNSRQIYQESLAGLNDLDRQGTIIVNDIKNSPYLAASPVLNGQAVRIEGIQKQISQIKENSKDYEYQLERDFKMRYAEALDEKLALGLSELQDIYRDAAANISDRKSRESGIEGYQNMTVSSVYPVYSSERLIQLREGLDEYFDQIENSLNLLRGNEFSPYSGDNQVIPGSINSIAELSSDAESLKADTDRLYLDIELEFLQTVYEKRNVILENEYESLSANYRYAKALADGEETQEKVGADFEEILKRYPQETQKLLGSEPQNINKFIAKLSVVRKSLTGLPADHTTDPRIAAALKKTEDLQKLASELAVNIAGLKDSSFDQYQKSLTLRDQGERFFETARTNIKNSSFANAQKNLNDALSRYSSSLELAWDRDVFNRIYIDIVSLRQDIVDSQRALVEKELSDIWVKVATDYRIGDYQSAQKQVNTAKQKWEAVFYDLENEEITYWSEIIENALKTNTGKEVAKTDAQYAAVSNLLSQAKQDYLKGQELYKQNNSSEGKISLSRALEKIDSVLNLFPRNQEANVLALRIEKITNPETWDEYLKERYNEAVSIGKSNWQDGLAQLGFIEELDPQYPGLEKAKKDMQIAGGIIKPVSTDTAKQADDLYKQAKKIVDSGRISQFPDAYDIVSRSLKLNPGNEDAVLLRNQIYNALADRGNPPAGASVPKMSEEDRRIYNSIIIKMNSGSQAQLNEAYIEFTALEQKGDNRNIPEIRKLGDDLRKLFGR